LVGNGRIAKQKTFGIGAVGGKPITNMRSYLASPN
jgi:hypothetical protein